MNCGHLFTLEFRCVPIFQSRTRAGQMGFSLFKGEIYAGFRKRFARCRGCS
jgi:hypothetical protein